MKTASKLFAAVATSALAWLTVGCGNYEPEPQVPRGTYYVPPPAPLTQEELAAREEAEAQAGEVAVGTNADEYADTDPSSLTEWKPVLEGHGAWVDDSVYGTVWVPASTEVGSDFQPYVSAGHWTYDESSDWVWVSDYSWGWAPFHYGRWVQLPGHGWSWIPGRRYSGAWVVWRTGPSGYGYVGWAPAAPDWYWYHGVAVGWSFGWYSPSYVYCSRDYLYHDHVHTHVVRGPAAREHDGRTQPYLPATPGVGGGGRVVATPGVGGSDRVVATPAVGGHAPSATIGRTTMRGPRPDEIGVKNDGVVAPPAGHAGLARAQNYATPRTAIAQGAQAPAGFSPRVNPSSAFAASRTSPNAAVAAAPSYQSRGVPVPTAVPRPSYGPRSAGNVLPETRPTVSNAPRYAAPSAAPSYRPPSVSSSPSFSSSPAFRSSPSVSAPAVRSTPSFSSSPAFRSSPSVSTPSMRSSPSPVFRSAPSAPAVRSTPSVAPSRPSSSSPASGVRGGRRGR